MNRQKLIIIILAVAALIILVGALRFFSGDEDIWLCQNGQWEKHGNPSAQMPTTNCGTPVASPTPSVLSEIEIYTPKIGDTIYSPVNILGQARGSWFFEAVFPVRLLDEKNNLLASGQAHAQGEWTTDNFVPFTVQLSYSLSATSSGVLIFNNDNPSGLPQNSKELRLPVEISPSL